MRVLFVCRGNIGRSQIAEAVFNSFANSEHEAHSAGVWVYDGLGRSQEGQKIGDIEEARVVLDSMREVGIDISNNQRKQVTPQMVNGADRVIIMAEDKISEFLKDSKKTTYWGIANPKGRNLKDTNRIRDEIVEHVKELLSELSLDVVSHDH